MTKHELVSLIRQHGHDASANTDGTITAQSWVSQRGKGSWKETYQLPANRKAVRDWLGY